MINRHLSYRTSNPALNSNTFKNPVKNSSLHLDNTMTIRGTVDKTALALCMLVISGYYSFSQENLTLMAVGGVIGFFLFITLIFKKSWAPFIVPLYSISQGFVVGGISYFYNSQRLSQGTGAAPRDIRSVYRESYIINISLLRTFTCFIS